MVSAEAARRKTKRHSVVQLVVVDPQSAYVPAASGVKACGHVATMVSAEAARRKTAAGSRVGATCRREKRIHPRSVSGGTQDREIAN